jgi:hypothetical protein
MMDSGVETSHHSSIDLKLPTASDLIIINASSEEEAFHQQLMEDIAKKAKNPPTWLH